MRLKSMKKMGGKLVIIDMILRYYNIIKFKNIIFENQFIYYFNVSFKLSIKYYQMNKTKFKKIK